MKIYLVSNLLRFRARSRLRRIMRGYRRLKKTERLGEISEVKGVLTNLVINQSKARTSQYIFGEGINNAELIVRQYLLVRIAGLGLNKSILYALGKKGGKVIHPLPGEWRNILKQNGFDVADFRSGLMWYGYICLLWCYGVVSFLKSFVKTTAAMIRIKPQVSMGRYAYFNTLSKGNLPQEFTAGKSHDIVSWYYDNIGHLEKVDTLCHSVKGVTPKIMQETPVLYLSSPIPLLDNYKQLIQFLKWGVVAISRSFIDVFRGRWWHAIMLHEAVMATQAKLQNPDSLAKDYMFHNSSWIYRPLWTYEAERSGSRILFYFYSTNVESFLKADGSKGITYGWQASNWPHILVWDKGQVDFIRNDVGDTSAKISEVGYTWFTTSGGKLNKLPTRTVAVFDVQPMRDAYYQTLGLDLEYYVPNIAKQFLLDIYSVLNANKLTMALKRKRKIGDRAHPKYRYFVEGLKDKPNYISIDPEIAASHVIGKCSAVISMPFTSTAILAREQGKPSVYYDPFLQCQKEDPAAHGIEILSGKKELQEWVEQIVESL